MNYAESGGNANRQFFAQAGNAAHPRLGGAHASALPLAADGGQPSVQGRLPAQGRLHLQQGAQRDRRRRVDRCDVEPAVAVSPQLRAGRLRPSAHAADGLRVRAALHAREHQPRGVRGQELADQRHRVVAVGHAVLDRRRQRPAAAGRRLADDQRGWRGQAGLRRGGTQRAVVRPRRVRRYASATHGATAAATRSADRRTGTSTPRCSG